MPSVEQQLNDLLRKLADLTKQVSINVSWCQDWFWRSKRSLQNQINALDARVTALEKNQIDLKNLSASLKQHTDPVRQSLESQQ